MLHGTLVYPLIKQYYKKRLGSGGGRVLQRRSISFFPLSLPASLHPYEILKPEINTKCLVSWKSKDVEVLKFPPLPMIYGSVCNSKEVFLQRQSNSIPQGFRRKNNFVTIQPRALQRVPCSGAREIVQWVGHLPCIESNLDSIRSIP